jgi:hypothetical protein
VTLHHIPQEKMNSEMPNVSFFWTVNIADALCVQVTVHRDKLRKK